MAIQPKEVQKICYRYTMKKIKNSITSEIDSILESIAQYKNNLSINQAEIIKHNRSINNNTIYSYKRKFQDFPEEFSLPNKVATK